MTQHSSLVPRLTRLVAPVRRTVNSPRHLVGVILGIWVGCSAAYALLEHRGPVESLWWGVVTGSTVGYGDFYPDSTAGRGVAVVLIVSMLVFVPIAIGHVIAGLVTDRNEFSHEEQVALAGTVESLHDHVAEVEHLVLAGLVATHGAAWVESQVAGLRARQDTGGIDDHMLALFATDTAATTAPAAPAAAATPRHARQVPDPAPSSMPPSPGRDPR